MLRLDSINSGTYRARADARLDARLDARADEWLDAQGAKRF
jgi:hypothetical protein